MFSFGLHCNIVDRKSCFPPPWQWGRTYFSDSILWSIYTTIRISIHACTATRMHMHVQTKIIMHIHTHSCTYTYALLSSLNCNIIKCASRCFKSPVNSIVCTTACSGWDQRKHWHYWSLVRETIGFPPEWPVIPKVWPRHDVIAAQDWKGVRSQEGFVEAIRS